MRFPAIICAPVRTRGVTLVTAGQFSRMAWASSSVRLVTVPAALRTPLWKWLPEKTVSRLSPSELTWASIILFAPWPMATMAITAPTPMIIPSMVRLERILFLVKAR